MDRPAAGLDDAQPIADDTQPIANADAPRRSGAGAPRLFDIAPGAPFLPTLVESLCDGTLVPGFPARPGDPLALADATIYVPTRRAARELRAAFVTALAAGGTAKAAILPAIRALGDAEDEGAHEASLFGEAGAAALDRAPVIDATERTVTLARLALAWIRALPDRLSGLHGGAAIEVPSSPADAIWLAHDLAALMDEMEGQGTDWRELVNIDPGDQAIWWQLTTEFLKIATQAWPAILADRDRSNPAAHANAAIRAEAARLQAGGARGPVVVAVSPNLGPAQTDFVRAVASMEGGAVVLPGLDRRLDDGAFARVAAGSETAGRAPGHSQFGHARLLAALGASREEVRPLGTRSRLCIARGEAVAEAMRPSEDTHLWHEAAGGLDASAFDGASLIEAPTPREEALAIAATLRGAIEAPGSTAALVTPDRALARRVAVELRRFGIQADDSAGTPLLSTGAGALLRLVLAAALEPGDPHALLGLLKHPLARFGLERSAVRRATLAVEMIALRSGHAGRVEIERLGELFEDRLGRIERAERKPHWLPRFDEAALDEARDLIVRVEVALGQLVGAARADIASPPSVWAGHIAVALDFVGADAEGRHDRLYGEPDGAVLAAALRGLMAVEDVSETGGGLLMRGHEVAGAFDALLAQQTVRRPSGGHPRVAVLGLIESRLLAYDTLVLGGLNDGAWPRQTTNDAFLSRPMREVLRLEPPERRIGLEAHDFLMAMGAEKVVLTRSLRSEGAPTTPSRWLQRLEAVLPEAVGAMRSRGAAHLRHCRDLDATPEGERPPRATRPAPTPPLAARPTRISITEIETLVRDPYAVYARRVLGLEPLDPPRAEPGPAERGTLFHAIVETFVREGVDPTGEDARQRLLDIAHRHFEEAELPEAVRALWWPRLEGTVDPFLAWERDRRARVRASHVEARASLDVGGTRVTGYADRVDLMEDGRVEIVDYKTGTNPTSAQARSLLSPQLALEAALAARGAFRTEAGPLKGAESSSLLYVRLRPGEDSSGPRFKAEAIEKGKNPTTAAALADRAWEELGALLARFRDPHEPYPSRLMPVREGEIDGTYDHLARAREWSVGGDDEAEGDED